LTTLIACLLLAVAGYAVFARRRHQRLRADCSAAFERAYATTSPQPAFEMAYSYGEPVFKVQFASKEAMASAADTNAAFLRAVAEICKDLGRKRQFKAERAVYFRHPDDDAPVVVHCCDTMSAQVGRTIAFSEGAKAYGLKTSIVGTPPIAIARCPWCGSTLPPAGS
jgi:hypothetical protein